MIDPFRSDQRESWHEPDASERPGLIVMAIMVAIAAALFVGLVWGTW